MLNARRNLYSDVVINQFKKENTNQYYNTVDREDIGGVFHNASKKINFMSRWPT